MDPTPPTEPIALGALASRHHRTPSRCTPIVVTVIALIVAALAALFLIVRPDVDPGLPLASTSEGSVSVPTPGGLVLPTNSSTSSGSLSSAPDGVRVPTDLVGRSASIASSELSDAGFRAVHWVDPGTGDEIVPHSTYAVASVPSAGRSVNLDEPLYVYVTPHDFESGRDARAEGRTGAAQQKDCGYVRRRGVDIQVTVTTTDDVEPVDCIAADSTALRYLSGTARDNGDPPVDMDCTPGWRAVSGLGLSGWTATCRSTGVTLSMAPA